MKIIVCDMCYAEGIEVELGEPLHNCGELGELCEKHYSQVKKYITNKETIVRPMEEVKPIEKEEVVDFKEQMDRRKKLPWL